MFAVPSCPCWMPHGTKVLVVFLLGVLGCPELTVSGHNSGPWGATINARAIFSLDAGDQTGFALTEEFLY